MLIAKFRHILKSFGAFKSSKNEKEKIMINLKIGASERRFNNIGEIDENWINQQINGLRNDRHSTFIRISINEGPVHMSLQTIDCTSSDGGGRMPNNNESKIFDLWKELRLDSKSFNGETLVVFFKRIRNIVC